MTFTKTIGAVLFSIAAVMPLIALAGADDAPPGAAFAGSAGAPAGDPGDAGDSAGPGPGATAVSGPPAPAKQVLKVGDVVYTAMGTAGLAVIDVSSPDSPVVVANLLAGMDVRTVQLLDGRLMVVMADYTVVTCDLADPLHPVPLGGVWDAAAAGGAPGASGDGAWQETVPAPPGEPPPPEEPLPAGKVIAISDGWVVIDVGSSAGVVEGMNFEIHRKSSILKAVVTIASVGESKCAGPLPPRGTAAVGDDAHATSLKWKAKYWMGSPMAGPVTQLALEIKPIIGAEDDGAGTAGFLSRIVIAHQFRSPFRLVFFMSAGGVATSAAGTGSVFEFGSLAELSTTFVGWGWGLGGHLSSGMHDDHAMIFNSLRFGALNGFHFSFLFAWLVPGVRDDKENMLPATTIFDIEVPVLARLALYVELGGGNIAKYEDRGSGWANILFGVRTMLHGTGGPGTAIMSVGMGHAYVWDEEIGCLEDGGGAGCEGGSAWGPTFSIGLDWRF